VVARLSGYETNEVYEESCPQPSFVYFVPCIVWRSEEATSPGLRLLRGAFLGTIVARSGALLRGRYLYGVAAHHPCNRRRSVVVRLLGHVRYACPPFGEARIALTLKRIGDATENQDQDQRSTCRCGPPLENLCLEV
jgi:hypothetical protein